MEEPEELAGSGAVRKVLTSSSESEMMIGFKEDPSGGDVGVERLLLGCDDCRCCSRGWTNGGSGLVGRRLLRRGGVVVPYLSSW